MAPLQMSSSSQDFNKQAYEEMMTAQLLLWKNGMHRRHARRRSKDERTIEKTFSSAWETLERFREAPRDTATALREDVERSVLGLQRALGA